MHHAGRSLHTTAREERPVSTTGEKPRSNEDPAQTKKKKKRKLGKCYVTEAKRKRVIRSQCKVIGILWRIKIEKKMLVFIL